MSDRQTGATGNAATPEATTMVSAAIPEHLYARIQAFKPVVEMVLEEPISEEDYVTLLLDRALPLMLAELIPHDASVLLQTLDGLAARHPTAIYGYVAEMLGTGAGKLDREAIRGRIGFRPPER
jgi:hypothetical protein